MPKPKRGLHKEISSIFKGVPTHRDGGAAPQGPGPSRLPWPERPKPEKQEPQPQHQESTPQIEQPKPPSEQSGPSTPTQPRQEQLPKPEDQQPASPDEPTKTEQPKPEPVSPATKQPEPTPRPPEPTVRQPEPVIRRTRPSAKQKFALPAQWQRAFEQIKTRVLTPKPGVDPKRQKAMVIVVPVLVIVLVIMLSKMLSKPAVATAKSSGFGSPVAAASNASSAEINWQVPKPYPPTLRDPTIYGPRPSAGENSKLLIRGIVYSKDNPSAVIGTRIVRAGDKVAGVKVIKINQNSVEFECDGKRWTQQVQ